MKNNNLKPGDRLIMSGYLFTALSVIIIYFTTDDIRLLILATFASLSALAGMIINSLDAYSGGYPFSISGDIRSVPS